MYYNLCIVCVFEVFKNKMMDFKIYMKFFFSIGYSNIYHFKFKDPYFFNSLAILRLKRIEVAYKVKY